jgi:flagellar basal body rod protein FlgB
MERQLDRLWLNQRAAAQNLANLHTPGYRGVRIEDPAEGDFSVRLQRALDRTDPRHLPTADPAGAQGFVRRTLTDLSPDTEMAESARSETHYQSLLEIVGRRDKMIRSAMEGR